VPGYTILGELGRGAMGVVYKARQVALNRTVALKTVRHPDPDPVALVRFLAEAEVVAAVRHPNVVQVYESGRHAGAPYMAMEYLSGGTLSDRLRGGTRLDAREAAGLVGRIARGVAAAHDAGVVHRDLKPANVLFDERGEPKVTDFGLAKRAAADLTASEALMGSPAYMAPEQAGRRAAVRRGEYGRAAREGDERGAGGGPVAAGGGTARSGDDRREVPGEGAGAAVPGRGGTGRRPGPVRAR
jgi:serine/threonine protein kinase